MTINLYIYRKKCKRRYIHTLELTDGKSKIVLYIPIRNSSQIISKFSKLFNKKSRIIFPNNEIHILGINNKTARRNLLTLTHRKHETTYY